MNHKKKIKMNIEQFLNLVKKARKDKNNSQEETLENEENY